MANYTQKRLAEICGVSPRWIRQLTSDGKLTRGADRTYPESAIAEFISTIQERQIRDDSGFRDLLEQEKYREKKRDNDTAERLVATVELLERAIEKGVSAMIPILETLPSIMTEHWPDINGGQLRLVENAVAQCRDVLEEVKIEADGN